MAVPGLRCRFSRQSTYPQDDQSFWFDISPYVLSFHIRRGKQRILDRFEPGTMELRLKNTDRRFDPTYTGSPYPITGMGTYYNQFPNACIPMRYIQLGFVIGGVTFWAFTGLVERWPQIWEGPTWGEVDITCVDAFEFFNTHALASDYAQLTNNYGTFPLNSDLTYTAVQIGFVGNSTTVTQVVAGLNTPLSVSVVGTDITVNLATNGAGAPTSTVTDVVNAVNASGPASALVTASSLFGPGTGIVTALAKTNLAGGTFVQQYAGARISSALQKLNWSSATNIATGTYQMQAQALAVATAQNGLDYLQQVEASDLGSLFMNRNGIPTYLDLATLAAAPYSVSQATFADRKGIAPGAIPYTDLQGDYDKDLIYNNIMSTRLNGTLQQVQDANSQSAFYTRNLELTPLSISDADSLALANAYLTKFSTPYFRFEPLKAFPGTDSAIWLNLVQRDLMDLVTVVRNPPGGGAGISKTGRLIQVEIEGTKSLANTVFRLQIDPTA